MRTVNMNQGSILEASLFRKKILSVKSSVYRLLGPFAIRPRGRTGHSAPGVLTVAATVIGGDLQTGASEVNQVWR